MMRYFFLLLLFPFCVDAQNILPNGGFEDENICTEYGKNCAPEAWIATSLRANYYFDDQPHAHTGNHFAGLILGNQVYAGVRSFIRTQLLCKLQSGHKYNLEFFVRSNHPVFDSIGVYFSPNDFLFDKRLFKDFFPQLWTKDGLDSAKYNPAFWQKVHFIYTASGDEQYITIGNFKHGEYKLMGHTEYENNFYFFLDDVSLTPVDVNEKLCSEADSIKTVIYNENDRHDLLERKIYYYRKTPPRVMHLPQTINIRIDTLLIPDIFFATAKYEIDEKNSSLLDSFCNKIKTRIVDSLIIEGNTDSVGKISYNEKLSENRAKSVEEYVMQKTHLAVSKIIVRFYASTHPAALNNTAKGRQKNRRVEMYLYSHS
jgi:outer membrane protein OmpA-like peptidoglycan-associated protein